MEVFVFGQNQINPLASTCTVIEVVVCITFSCMNAHTHTQKQITLDTFAKAHNDIKLIQTYRTIHK